MITRISKNKTQKGKTYLRQSYVKFDLDKLIRLFDNCHVLEHENKTKLCYSYSKISWARSFMLFLPSIYESVLIIIIPILLKQKTESILGFDEWIDLTFVVYLNLIEKGERGKLFCWWRKGENISTSNADLLMRASKKWTTLQETWIAIDISYWLNEK